jgi:hypothetical protein
LHYSRFRKADAIVGCSRPPPAQASLMAETCILRQHIQYVPWRRPCGFHDDHMAGLLTMMVFSAILMIGISKHVTETKNACGSGINMGGQENAIFVHCY